jgi:poly-gamma-glutamate capsule biosynthesis protein CapA/YwtB (metallophosphatase superfamily)
VKSKERQFFIIVSSSVLILLLVFGTLAKNGKVFSWQFNSQVEIILTGDVMLGRSVMTKSLGLNDPAYPFQKVADRLQKADVVFINLENPMVENCPWTTEGLIFCADPKMVEGLTFAGIDVVTLANNHSENYGQAGLTKTKQVLESRGIEVVGLDNLIIKQVKGMKFGFLGFDFVSQTPTDQNFELVRQSDNQVDFLIVGVHWGGEYQAKPSSRQKEWAEKLVNAGADVVVGHHSHWIGDIDYINSKQVYYSLGNFVFDQMWSQQTREGLVIKLVFENGQLKAEKQLRIRMNSWAQPEFTDSY